MREAEYDGMLDVVRSAMSDDSRPHIGRDETTRLLRFPPLRPVAANDNEGDVALEPFPDGGNAAC